MRRNNFRSAVPMWAALSPFVLWLGAIAAYAYEDGMTLFAWMGRFSQVLERPFSIGWTAHTPKFMLVSLIIYAFGIALYYSGRENRRPGEEYGSARWGDPRALCQKYMDHQHKTANIILTRRVRLGMDGYITQRNMNILVVGGSGSGKTRFFCKPGIYSANCSYLITDPKGELLRAAGGLLVALGYEVRVFNLIDPSQSDCYNPFAYECVIPDKDGGTMSLLAHSESFTTPQGERAIFSTFLDVSENTALRKEKSIRDALCADYIAVYLVDLMQDSVVPVTEATRKDDANGQKRLGDSIHSFSARMQFAYDELLVRESAPDFLQKMNAEYLMQYLNENRRFILRCRMKPNPAKHEWFEIQIVRMDSDESFQVVMGFRFVDDILREEKRKKEILESALASANRKKEIITAISKQYWQVFEVDLVSDTYQEVFTEGRFTMDAPDFSGRAHEDFRQVLNDYTAEEYLAQMRDFLDLDTLAARLADTDTVTMEFWAKAGFWASVRYLALTRDAEGCVTKVIFLLEIIDEQKRKELEYQKKLKEAAEEASRANAAKTNFLRRMSHDIRTPLNGIIGLLKIDETHCDDADLIRENRRKILTSADHLLSLINDVLQMSRLEDGKIVLTHEPICLYDLTQNIVDIIIGRAVEAGIQWDYEKGKSKIPYPYIYGSPLHLRQIFLNIYGNCIKYNRPGGKITTVVDTLPEHDGICTYHWIISDTGIGMSEEFLKHLFEPFAQERSNARSAYQGTGLGMSIVKGLLEQMGGTISVTSKFGVGSTFEITIPFEIAPAPTSLPEQNAQEMQDIRGLRLLLAEDNELNAEIAQTLLTDEGAVVTIVHDGQKAVEAFSKHPAGTFDAILMDMMMPVMDGLTATKTIRALERHDAKTIPIIAMTANAFAEDAQRCLDAGMNAHLAKPLEIQKAISVIAEFCR